MMTKALRRVPAHSIVTNLVKTAIQSDGTFILTVRKALHSEQTVLSHLVLTDSQRENLGLKTVLKAYTNSIWILCFDRCESATH